jgi:hypothetical protein
MQGQGGDHAATTHFYKRLAAWSPATMQLVSFFNITVRFLL